MVECESEVGGMNNGLSGSLSGRISVGGFEWKDFSGRFWVRGFSEWEKIVRDENIMSRKTL